MKIRQSPSGFDVAAVIADGATPGDTPVWDGTQWIGKQNSTFAAQAAWFVNSVTGADTNDGATAATPIKTLAELTLRLRGATLGQNTTVTLDGDFSSEALRFVDLVVAPAFQLTITGTPTQQYAGTLTAVTNARAGLNAPDFTDAAIVSVAPYIGMRARLTSGLQVGATTWLQHELAATQVQVSQWFANHPVDAAPGDTYVIETLTPIGDILLGVDGYVTVTDIDCSGSTVWCPATLAFGSGFLACNFQGPDFNAAPGNPPYLQGCNFTTGNSFNGPWILNSPSALGPGGLYATPTADLELSSPIFQNSSLVANNGATVSCTTDAGFVNCTAPAINLWPDSSFIFRFAGTVWGTVTGTYAVLVAPGATFVYTSRPTINATYDVAMGGSYLPWTSTPIALSGAIVAIDQTPVPDALEVPFAIVDPATTAAVNFPAGAVLATPYTVEFVETAPAGGTPAPSSGPWATAIANNGFTANIGAAPGAGVTRNFTARVKL